MDGLSPKLATRCNLVGDPMMGARGPEPPEAPDPTGKWEPTRRSGELTSGHGDPALNGGGEPPQLLPDVDRRRPVIPGGVPTQNWI